MIESIRTKALWAVIVLALLVIPLAVLVARGGGCWRYLRPPRAARHLRLLQPRHSILRNYPLAGLAVPARGHGSGAAPVPRRERHRRPPVRPRHPLAHLRARQGRPRQEAVRHRADVYEAGYTWMDHSIAPRPMVADPEDDLRVTVGGPQCTQPY